jgi:predicted XRE-type DNA-binding protein
MRRKVNTSSKSGNDIGIEHSSGNIYADLGMSDATEMLLKAQLAIKIGEIIKARKWTQQEASVVLNLPQSKLSILLRGQFRGISEAKMIDCLNRLGRDVQIVIGTARKRTGRTEVICN